MAASDERTREYLLDLMQRVPKEIASVTREIRAMIGRTQDNADAMRIYMERMDAKLAALQKMAHELCNLVQQAVAIGPLWDITQGKDEADE